MLLTAPPGLLLAVLLTGKPTLPPGLAEAADTLRAKYQDGDLIAVVAIPAQDAYRPLKGLPFLILSPGERAPTEGFRRVWVVDGRRLRPAEPLPLAPPTDRFLFEGVVVSVHPLPRGAG